MKLAAAVVFAPSAIILGSSTGAIWATTSPDMNSKLIVAEEGFIALLICREARNKAELAVAPAGDVDAHDHDDLQIGAFGASPMQRAADDAAGSELAELPGSVRVIGAKSFDFTGSALSLAGDVDGVGLADVDGEGEADHIVDAYGSDPSGSACAILGTALSAARDLGAGTMLSLDALGPSDGAPGARIDESRPGSYASFDVAGAGDVDADGRADIIIGAPNADLSHDRIDAGQAIIISGASISGFGSVGLNRPTAVVPEGESVRPKYVQQD